MLILSIILLIIAVIVQAYDAWSTITIIEGDGREINSLVRWLIEKAGLRPAVIGLKATISLLLAVPVWLCGHLWPVPVALGVVIAIYVRVFWKHNFRHDGI